MIGGQWPVAFLVPVLYLIANLQHGSCQGAPLKRGYILTAPSVFDINSSETLCLTLQNVSSNGTVRVQLIHSNSNVVVANTTQNIDGEGSKCFELFVPPTSLLEAELSIEGSFSQDNYEFNNSKRVSIGQTSDLIIIQTDKPMYKPGDKVQFRILQIKPNFQETDTFIKSVWVENPSQVRMVQWKRSIPEHGITDLSFKLSSEPQLGNWVIFVEDGLNNQVKRVFKVDEYVLPKYSVKITPPSVILTNFQELSFKVCAHYTYGEPVAGKLKANITVKLGNTFYRASPTLSNITVLQVDQEFRECRTMTLNRTQFDWKVLGESREYFPIQHATFTFSAEVKELGTDVTMEAAQEVAVKRTPFALSFVSKPYYKPQMRYFGKVKAAAFDGQAVANEKLRVELKGYDSRGHQLLSETHDVETDENGIAHFQIANLTANPDRITTKVIATNHESITQKYEKGHRLYPYYDYSTFYQQPTAYSNIKSWFSPSNSFVQIEPQTRTLKCGQQFSFAVNFTKLNLTHDIDAPYQLVVHYQIISRGNVVEQKSLNFNTKNGELLNGQEDKQSFKITTTILPIMAPKIQLLVYYVREDGEVVSDSESFTVEKCFANKVEMSFEEEKVLPGAPVHMHLSSSPNSLCAVSVTDKSTHLMSNEQFDKHKSFSMLEAQRSKLHTYRPTHTYCPRNSSNEGYYVINENIIGSVYAFDDIGVVTLSDLSLLNSPCQFVNRRALSYDDDYYRAVRGPTSNAQATTAVRYRSRGRERSRGMATQLSPGSPASVAPLSAVNKETGSDSAPEPSVQVPIVEVRDHFPETWLWEMVSIGNESELSVSRNIPHTITEWTGSAFCMSSSDGLGVSSEASVKSFQPFFLSYTMPYSVKNGEIFPLTVTLFNYLSKCFPVIITLDESHEFQANESSTQISACLCAMKSFTHKFYIQPLVIGEVNITVRARAAKDSATICKDRKLVQTVEAFDAVTRFVRVKPQGFPKESTQTNWMCLKSNKIVLSNTLKLPKEVVEGSVRAYASVTGDLMGPTMNGLDSLVRLPTGCGEQNMVLFVPNIYVIMYLNASNQLTEAMKEKSLRYMQEGYQRELNYKRDDGSYSAFGKSDAEGSMWLTAFVLKSFAAAQKIMYISPYEINSAMQYLLKNQLEDGCFKSTGRLLHKEMQGNVGDNKESQTVSLSLYVTIALLEAGFNSSSASIKKAFSCFKNSEKLDLNQLIMKQYASLLLNQTDHNEIFSVLKQHSKSEGGVINWSANNSKSLAYDIELTSYALLTLASLDVPESKEMALRVVRWLSKQRNSNGGFVSTQDTVMALQAIEKYVSQVPKEAVHLSFDFVTEDFTGNLQVNEDNRLVMQTLQLPQFQDQLIMDIDIQGKGCVLLQLVLKYNTHTFNISSAFSINVTSTEINDNTIQSGTHILGICTRYLGSDEVSNMAIVEVQMVSGFETYGHELEKLKNPVTNLKRWEIESDGTAELYFDELSNENKCFNIILYEKMHIENRKAATIKVYDYYQPEMVASVEYSLKSENTSHQ